MHCSCRNRCRCRPTSARAQVLQRGQEISRRTWTVLRVAVVELRGNTFMGRAWFGDAVTGQVRRQGAAAASPRPAVSRP